MIADRRTFVAAAISIPLLPQTRKRQVGHGRHSLTGELLHETIATERWDGAEWVRIGGTLSRLYEPSGSGQFVREFIDPPSLEEIAASRRGQKLA